ncbi:MAG: hypothetical protein A4E55_00388 [Pelotomaculum sp. PtaU1.Bin035]|nr:MAG: hypothetical protein A4E55_00388 [Pelotomaculum sp. PtaU1.Bin035]
MAVAQDEILSMFVTELREKALLDFRHSDQQVQDRYNESRELSMKLNNILKELSEEKWRIIEDYMDKTSGLVSCQLDYLYLKGIKDGFKLVKMLELI